MIKLHKIILTLTVLVVIVSNILVETQDFPPVPPTSTTPNFPIIPIPPKTPPQPPPPIKTPPPPPAKTPPPPPAKSTDLPPPAKSTEPPPPPAKSTDLPPPATSTDPKTTEAPPPKQSEPLSPPPSLTSAPASPSPSSQFCATSKECDNTKFCNQGICQPRGLVGDKCVIKDACSGELICNKGFCQFRDNETTKNHNYDVKKAAITGGIIVGIFVIGGFMFIVYRSIKKRKERKGREITSSVYSTDGTAEFDPIYPFSERTNSFSSSKPTPPSLVPTTNHYDPLPPTGNGGFIGGPGSRQGYYNYYNNDYKGGYMRQNENEVTKRTMNLLQQTRGNVMIAPHAPHAPPHIPHAQHPQLPQHPRHVPHAPHPPHPPPHLQQNYNWNYGVPGVQPAPPAQQQLFPVPSVTRQYGGSKPNNMNNDVKNNLKNKIINNNSFNSSNSSNSYEVNSGDKQKKTQNLRDLLDSNSVDSTPSNSSDNYNVESIYDTYARDSIFKPKTLEVKLSQTTNNNNDIKDDLSRNTPEKKYNSTIKQNVSKDSKPVTRRSRSRTFGHVDSKIKSSTVEEQKNGSKGLNGINEYNVI